MPTAVCPVCYREYEYTNARTDRCPICVPQDEPEPDDYDYDQTNRTDPDGFD
jgi:hypothetical protein